MEDEEDDVLQQQQRKNKTVIKIPSFQEVLESSQSKTTSPSLFTPDPSFTQAFSFIKSSEFYSPPPPPPPAAAPSSSQSTSTTPSTPSQSGQSNLHPRSSSSVSNSAPSRNAILVSPRQKGNPLLKHIRNVKWAFSEGIVCDYLLGQNSCALYLRKRQICSSMDRRKSSCC